MAAKAQSDEAYLHAHGIDVAPDTLNAMVREAVDQFERILYVPDPRTEFTEQEIRVLDEGGFDLRPDTEDDKDPLAAGAAEYAALLETSYSTAETAEMLSVTTSRIRQRIKDKSLYGIKHQGNWSLPAFQFINGAVVPGFGEVARQLDPALHPVAMYRWFTLPNVDLVREGTDKKLSPRQWLTLGLPIDPVVRLARHL